MTFSLTSDILSISHTRFTMKLKVIKRNHDYERMARIQLHYPIYF